MAVKLEKSKLPELASYLTQHLPSAFKVRGSLMSVIQNKSHQEFWVDAWPRPKAVVATPVAGNDYLSNVYDVFAEDQSALMNILDDKCVITWESTVAFPCLSEANHSAVKESAGKHGWNVETFGPQRAELYYMERNDLKIINPPPGITVCELSSKDVEVVNSRWKFNSGHQSMSAFQFWIENFPSVALFDAEGQLVASEVTTHSGVMGRLYVMPEHRRKGYASYVISALAQKCFAMDIRPFLNLEVGNHSSVRLHKKMGFRKAPLSPLMWVKTERKGCGGQDTTN